MNAYVVWKFSKNIDGAKKFLVDLTAESREAFRASQFYNSPTYPQLVKDLGALIANDPKAQPSNKYNIFANASQWTVNVGYPGYANAAVDEIFNRWLIPDMFADVASGKLSAEASMEMYAGQVDRIFDKWRSRGKV